MAEAMVTGRITPQLKRSGNAVLKAAGLNSSQAINLMYEKLASEKSAAFLQKTPQDNTFRAKLAEEFVDSLVLSASPEFAGMSDKEIRMRRLAAKGMA